MVAVIGDLVGSRRAADRAALQRSLVAVLHDVNSLVPALQPLEPTIGDEFQATYPDLGSACLAALLVRLALLDTGADVRAGLGAGTTTVVDPAATPPVLDGPAWWAARRAVETAERLAASPRSRSARTWFVDRSAPVPGDDARHHDHDHDDDEHGDVSAAAGANAFLAVRDDVIARMSPRARRLLAHQLRGHPQQVVAQAEGVTQPAVSQALARSGALAVWRGQQLLAQHRLASQVRADLAPARRGDG
ncbi:SatD family protein [Streptomyces sp. NP160]|uniref:SatD family protein n=1 Tax=Streptomyces sp. NP160 TaxID=2586637 RepID=UPI0015D5F4C8|nr:SatD family protein [Streptomyces sp. NP160]